MVERVIERKREPEPEEDHYDKLCRLKSEQIRRRMEGKVIIRGSEIPWVQGRQALVKRYLIQEMWDEVATPNWEIFVQRIKQHSGCHIHQGGLAIFVLEGAGYSLIDGVRYDWEAEDLMLLPIKPGGVEHQHFNHDADRPALWMAFRYEPMLDQVCVGITQVAEHPDWAGPKKK
ncbi:MAG: hypothetical protein HYY29_01265 [Chloroflexi bacterium]|nr:hypothetical protein [Chloroflexota bacterium]